MIHTVEERREQGRSLRKLAPLWSHAEWLPGSDRADPIDRIEAQNENRLDWLVPLRRFRMTASPIDFFRGNAVVMAADLAGTAVSGLVVQASGDAHLGNFSLYSTPERSMVFDVDHFDETLPGPWEWDVKRLATSFEIAGRQLGLGRSSCGQVTRRVVRAYREAMMDFGGMDTTDAWFVHLPPGRIAKGVPGCNVGVKAARRFARDRLRALLGLAEEFNGGRRIRSLPPLLVPLRDLKMDVRRRRLRRLVEESFEAYRRNVGDESRRLLDRFRPIDIALQAVGVGGLGLPCLVLLLEGRDRDDLVFLQVKEARRSVLEDHLPESSHQDSGRRVVEGQRLMQIARDLFIGWTRAPNGRHYYWRELRSWNGAPDFESARGGALRRYARLCGWTLARSHARSGDPVAISGYLGKGTGFDRAAGRFAQLYADQNERDHASYVDAIWSGRLEVAEG